MKTPSIHRLLAVLVLFSPLSAPALLAQTQSAEEASNKRLLSRDLNEPSAPSPYESDPYGRRPGFTKVDRDEVRTFLRDMAGAGEGPVPESEAEEIVRSFQAKYGVYIPDRDLLLTSGLDRQSLINALSKSLLESHGSGPKHRRFFIAVNGTQPDLPETNEVLYRTSDNKYLRWKDLPLLEKQAIQRQIETGIFEKVQAHLLMPGSRDQAPEYSQYAGPNGDSKFDPNGNRMTYPFPVKYQSPQVVGSSVPGPNGATNQSGARIADVDAFLEYGPNFNDIELATRTTYSNGRPRFDADGNELYPNGRRKFSDTGVPLYSNGRPRVDGSGNKLHSNGRKKFTADGRPLYANGLAKKTIGGVDLHRNGRRRWTEDGQGPDAVAMAARDAERIRTYTSSDELAESENVTNNPNALYDDARQPYTNPDPPPNSPQDVYRQEYTAARQLYANSQAKETEDSRKLFASGTSRYTGDKRGTSEFLFNDPPGIAPTPRVPPSERERKPDFVQRLYSNSRPAETAEGYRLYSNVRRRSADRDGGQFLYSNARPFASSDSQALKPSGAGIWGATGYQGRAQGKFQLYRILEGTVQRVQDGKLTLRPRGEVRETVLNVAGAMVVREGGEDPAPGDLGQLSRGASVRLVTRRVETFVDGTLVDEDEPIEVVAILTSNTDVGLPRIPDGSIEVLQVIAGVLRSVDLRTVRIAAGPERREVVLGVAAGAVSERIRERVLTPADIRAARAGSSVQVVARQQLVFEKGKVAKRSRPAAIAIIER